MWSKSASSTSVLQGCAAFWMTFGHGSAEGFYTAMSGYYIKMFNSSSFFIVMLLCLMAPKPIMSMLQQQFDSFFDKQFSTKATYCFRVIALQFVLGIIVTLWVWLPASQMLVLVVGFLLGSIGSSIVSSSLQMAAAMGPTKIISSKLGLQIGGAVPFAVLHLTKFSPSSSRSLFQKVVSFVVAIYMLAAVILGFFHLRGNIFEKAYKRLAYDLWSPPVEIDRLPGTAADELLSGSFMQVQITETRGLDPSADKGVPSWVCCWQSCIFLVMSMSCYLLSMAGFFEGPDMAQELVLLKLVMELVGRLAALTVPVFPAFERGPWHGVMVSSVFLAAACSVVCIGEMLGDARIHLFVVSWCCIFALGIFANSLTDVTTGAYIEVLDRKAVARTNQMMIVSGELFGLIMSECTKSLV